MSTNSWGGARAHKARALLAPLVAQGCPCYRCGRPILPGQSWDADHILDRAQGGTDDPSNLWPSHSRCNTSAGGKVGAKITNAIRRERKEAQDARPSARARGVRGV